MNISNVASRAALLGFAAAATIGLSTTLPVHAAGTGALLPMVHNGGVVYHVLPGPPRPQAATLPSSRGTMRTRESSKSANVQSSAALAESATTTVVRFPGAPGSNTARKTLVLYDNVGSYAWLGEAYAVQAGQLASHGSAYVMHPAAAYQSGELLNYTGVIYIGSYYDTPLPTAFLDDVLSGARPVLWMSDNIWQLADRDGDFSTHYGWIPRTFSYDNTPTVTYKGVALKRSPLSASSGLLQTQITNPSLAKVIATATRTDGTSLPWATRSRNLTYIGEVPFSYVGPDDRYLAAADLISRVSNPAMPNRKRALVRIEDVGADADPAALRAIADYLNSRNVPFSVAVIPLYRDPNGVYNGGVPQTIHLTQVPAVVSALKYMQAKGGTLLMHGYTHQYSNVANPYTGASADDFEFYRAHVSSDNYVIYDGPVGADSTTWATSRIQSGLKELASAGLTKPTIFEPPHYAASAIDYQVFRQQFATRYDRGLYAAHWCPSGNCGTGTPDYTRIYGQFFPYLVRDIFGSVVVPENLGNVELVEFNHNPPRFPSDILASARRTTVIRDGVQSFFFHPYLDIKYLRTIVEGIQNLGYQFVSAGTVKQG